MTQANLDRQVVYSVAIGQIKGFFDITVVSKGKVYFIAMDINGTHYAFHSKNVKANGLLDSWYSTFRKKDSDAKESFDTLLGLLTIEKNFVSFAKGIDAYREYLNIRRGTFLTTGSVREALPTFPKRSFELMIEWYNELMSSKIANYQNETIDPFTDEIKLELERTLLKELIEELKNKYISPKPIESERKVAKPMGGNRTPKGDLIPIKRFYDWLLKLENKLSHPNAENNKGLFDLGDESAVAKLIYLKEVGVIDFLRTKQPFNTSINSLASVLSAISGEKVTTLQPLLNANLSNSTDKSKDFYKSTKAVSKVRNKLIEIGFPLK